MGRQHQGHFLYTKAGPHTDRRVLLEFTEARICLSNFYSPGAATGGAPTATSSALKTAFAPKCAGAAASSCSLRKINPLALNVASSNPWPWVIASVGQASTQ